MKKIPVIIDVDTGIDDAVAIALACFNNNLNILALTCVAGNCSVGRVVLNTLNILQSINKSEILVAEGARKPLIRERDENFSYHGRTGIGEFKFDGLKKNASLIDAASEMRDIILKSKEKITLICLGPLTNIATLLKKYPEVKSKIKKIAISGGLLDDDKNNPYPSFNVAQDPEATQIVLDSGVKLLIVPSDMGHIAYLTPQEVETGRVLNKTGAMFKVLFESYRDRHVKNGVATHDSCAVISVSNPELVTIKKMNICLRMVDEDLGVLQFDESKKPNAEVVVDIDKLGFKQLYFSELNMMP